MVVTSKFNFEKQDFQLLCLCWEQWRGREYCIKSEAEAKNLSLAKVFKEAWNNAGISTLKLIH